MRACPSCSAPLDDEGICTSCGALSRGYFRGLDLGAPQIAEAVANGLDFYRLLVVDPASDIRTIAKRYRQLRVSFPDNPSKLAPQAARRLALLEQAGRILTDPRLRALYDELRSKGGRAQLTTLGCRGCGAPLSPSAAQCGFCGLAQQPVANGTLLQQPPIEEGPPPTEPVDYYTLLGLSSEHCNPHQPSATMFDEQNLSMIDDVVQKLLDPRPIALRAALSDSTPRLQLPQPPKEQEIDIAALARQRETLLDAYMSPEIREARLTELEVARRILSDPRRRSTYDALLRDFRQGQLSHGRLDTLKHLQDEVLAEMAEERGELPSPAQAAALVKQGLGYLEMRLPREAIEVLKRATAALPQSVDAHSGYVRAILASDDPLSLGSHMLRQVLRSLEALDALKAPLTNSTALAALCRGLLARDAGDMANAEQELQRAVQLDSRLTPAWRGLAALASQRGANEEVLSYCRRALAQDPRDERALVMMIGACLNKKQQQQAYEIASQIATLRGENWTAEQVLHELTGL